MASTTQMQTQPQDPAPAELLKYLPEYEVVICTGCSYAVQPKAISRHLKEIHRVLRSRRRRFDLYVSGLKLRDPHDVEPPSEPGQFPVPYLPVESGFRCREMGCQHMCASTKRMEAHWRNEHGRKGVAQRDYSPTPLQTFFRGNLLRYFTSPDGQIAGLHTPVSLPHSEDVFISEIPPPTPSLNTTDTALLTHYFTTTYQTFVTGPETIPLWQDVIPTLATTQPFLLHGLLACTALHKAYLTHDPALKHQYTLLAYNHQDTALPGFRSATATPTPENCHATLAFSHLLIVYTFASELSISTGRDQPSLFLADTHTNRHHQSEFPIQPLPNWLYFMRGSCCMLQGVMDYILTGPVHALFDAWKYQPREEDDGGRETVLLRHLLSIIPPVGIESALLPLTPGSTASISAAGTAGDLRSHWTPSTIATYTQAARQLNTSFLYLRRQHPATITAWNVLRVWPMVVSLDYINLLAAEHPGALILLAHYCILLKSMERFWYFEGKARVLIVGIQRRLGLGWGGYIGGALECVLGGVDPGVWVQEAS
ncbi:hypothetical protein BJY04DRAFT_221344 [Aspergillus karnatakaensis]|uniref:uncharacterized protein n=1 Tax=Aspergillus karnatakaensis TaxID=1810916 RepID=UPI003CCE2556